MKRPRQPAVLRFRLPVSIARGLPQRRSVADGYEAAGAVDEAVALQQTLPLFGVLSDTIRAVKVDLMLDRIWTMLGDTAAATPLGLGMNAYVRAARDGSRTDPSVMFAAMMTDHRRQAGCGVGLLQTLAHGTGNREAAAYIGGQVMLDQDSARLIRHLPLLERAHIEARHLTLINQQDGKDPPAHALAQFLPELDGKAFAALVADLKRNGRLYRAITLYQGQVLDGRARLRACREAGIQPDFVKFSGSEVEAIAFVTSENFMVRQLKPAQRAICAARLWQASEQARKSAKLQKLTQEQASEQMQVSVRHLATARSILDDEQRCAAVMSGKMSLAKAAPKHHCMNDAAQKAPSIKRDVGRLMAALVRVEDMSVDDIINAISDNHFEEQQLDLEKACNLFEKVLDDPRLLRKFEMKYGHDDSESAASVSR